LTHRRWLTVFFAFLLGTVAVLAAGMAVAVAILRQPGYAAEISDPSLAVQEKAFQDRDQACDVLIDGDSTASIGVDPRVITAQTGLSACNIASTRPIFDALGTLHLDAWLAHNSRPRVLVLQFGPEIFYREPSWEHIQPVAPYVMLLHNVSVDAAVRAMVFHPASSLRALQVVFKLRYFPPGPAALAHRREVYARTLAAFHESRGRLNLELPALSACDSKPLLLYGPLDSAWIKQLREKYEARGIITLVNSSPIPECDPQLAKFQHDLAPFLDADTKAMPIGLFVGGDRHMTADGARIEAAQLAEQIKSTLASRSPSSN
jgi:hypothetical protein